VAKALSFTPILPLLCHTVGVILSASLIRGPPFGPHHLALARASIDLHLIAEHPLPVDTSARHTWEAALGRLQLQVTRPSFETWLRGTTGVAIDDQTLVVAVPTSFAAEWLERRMYALIESAVVAVAPGVRQVAFRVEGSSPEPQRPVVAPASRPAVAQASPLNARYTFDSFVVGDCNQLAYAASMAVADAPGASYNPLFLYGASGLGKTHLLHAIGHRSREMERSVAYVTCEQFTNEFLAAIRERKTDAFRARYRAADLLLIDDIQFLAGKEGTQEGFFHTFNALHDSGRQIVLTCDRPPSALPLLEERLRTRFEWGLLADIASPSVETRTAMLAAFAESAPVAVPQGVLDFLADRTPGNVRQLEGCLNRVTAIAHFTNEPVTIALAQRALGATVAQEAGSQSPKAVIAAVAAHYGLPQAALLSARRDRPVANARQLAMYVLHMHLRVPAQEIGETLGGRDRTTVLYNVKKVNHRLRNDASFAQETAELFAAFMGSNDG
jgi:chromosomal replication initiator protein